LERQSRMQSSQYQPISMIHRDRLPRMLEPFQAWTSRESSTSQLLLLLLMDSTRKTRAKEMSSFSISVVAPLMCLFSVSKMEFSKSKPPMDTLTWEVKISITCLSITASLSSRSRLVSILLATQEPWEDSELSVRRPREFSQLPISLKSTAKPLPRVKTST